MYYSYILQSKKDKKIYIGITNNLERRLSEHNSGQSRSTKSRIPFILIYSEKYNTRMKARQREIWLKSGEGREYIKKNILK